MKNTNGVYEASIDSEGLKIKKLPKSYHPETKRHQKLIREKKQSKIKESCK